MVKFGIKEYIIGGVIGAAMFAGVAIGTVGMVNSIVNDAYLDKAKSYCTNVGIEPRVPGGYGPYSWELCSDILGESPKKQESIDQLVD